ncbi:CfaE/CblD family pilus tip adhesin [Rahnella victoriana]|uniref:Pilus assembly protein CblD n=1 Tax=Rahnella victoriana TaxID=1510570 RepID=A0ABS0DLG7_9GAMM|nr:CfaE/CblD family pilus tip adhesin [Rahnella victoriana]MBF7954465.1 pilus assembly protein CblD [Rahnella victoriana]
MNLTKSYFITALILIISVLAAQSARAGRVEPAGRDTPVTLNFDKSTLPPQLDIWRQESGGYDYDDPDKWGHNNWVCLSSSSAEHGACPTTSTWNDNGTTTLPLIFTEQRSHSTVTLNLQGYHSVYITGGGGCGEMGIKLVNAATTSSCSGRAGDEALLYLSIPPDQLAKIPAGGVWKAELKMSLMQWISQSGPSNKLADWNAHITLNVTDNNNQQIYLPEFGNAAPLVSLNMRPLPGTGNNKVSVTGTANIDVCLYDGYNANSSTFMLTLDDDFTGQSNRSGINFSIVRQGGDANNERDRMDYTINMLNPDTNTLQTVSRARQMNLTKIQQARIRQVHLPGIPEPVICVPAPLELSTGYLAVSSKNAGYYRGTLKLNFTTSLY